MSDSNDLTDRLPESRPRDTNPMLERILEELRALREEARETRTAVAALSAVVDRGFDDLRAEASRTRATFRDLITEEARAAAERLDAHEKRLRTIEDRERPQ